MRNLFDQYEQPENRLTHALMSVLHREPKLLRPFLRWLGVRSAPATRRIHIGQQQMPGTLVDTELDGQDGLPDGCLYDDDGWAVLIECKVQAGISISQLQRHRKTAARYGFENVALVLIAPDPPKRQLPADTHFRAWREVYDWFSQRTPGSLWVRQFVEYVQVFESKMLARSYNIGSTLTMFTGFHFDHESPYTYSEGKRLMRLIGQEFRQCRRLIDALQLDPDGKGRTALTRGAEGGVWDYIPLKAARGASFTAFPHATIILRPAMAAAAITIPNGLRGNITKRLTSLEFDGFEKMIREIEANLRPIVERVPGAQPKLYLLQRHYKSQRSIPNVDGEIWVDLRAMVGDKSAKIRHQPMWLEAYYNVLVRKRSNMQTGIEVYLPYEYGGEPTVMQTPAALDVMVDTWLALKPLLDFALGNDVA